MACDHRFHRLKILPGYFTAVMEERKHAEVRKADRDFRVGDFLLLDEFDCGHCTGRSCVRIVTYMQAALTVLNEKAWVLSIETVAQEDEQMVRQAAAGHAEGRCEEIKP